ncbi:MAG: hypothetical protein NTU49_09420 [Gammaproteobacteria bacterium]|nr:hypothetical protein [Gammaproteobacteria bacterium]
MRFSTEELDELSITKYRAQYAGNDPFNLQIPGQAKTRKPFVLVGTGCFRVIEIALTFCESDLSAIKKIYVIDNSVNVKNFWIQINAIFSALTNTAGIADLHDALKNTSFPEAGDDRINYLLGLIESILNDERVKTVSNLKELVSRVQFISQSWTSNSLFCNQLKTYCVDQSGWQVYVYTSNIFAMLVSESERNALVRNICALAPAGLLASNADKLLDLNTGAISTSFSPTECYYFTHTQNLGFNEALQVTLKSSKAIKRDDVNFEKVKLLLADANKIPENSEELLIKKLEFLMLGKCIFREIMKHHAKHESCNLFTYFYHPIGRLYILLMSRNREKAAMYHYYGEEASRYLNAALRFFDRYVSSYSSQSQVVRSALRKI